MSTIDFIRPGEFIIFRQLGYDFTQDKELQKIDPRKVNIQDSNGNTALHMCVRLGYVRAVALLLSLGADVYLTNARGVSPISFLDTLRSLNLTRDQESIRLLFQRHTPLSRDQESIRLLFQRSVTLTTITSALSCGIGKRSTLNLLPIELIRLLDVMLFKPVVCNHHIFF
jgi:Ankyrin repeat